MGHFHYCEECDLDVIYCDIPHCEYQEEARHVVISQHYEEHEIMRGEV